MPGKPNIVGFPGFFYFQVAWRCSSPAGLPPSLFSARLKGSPQSLQITLTSRVARMMVPQQGHTCLILRFLDFLLPPFVLPSTGWRLALILSLPKDFLIQASASAVDVVIFVVLLNVGAVGLGGGLELHTIGQKASSKSLKTYLFSLPKGTQKPCRSGANQINKLGVIALTYIFVFHQKSTFLSVFLHTLYILQQ